MMLNILTNIMIVILTIAGLLTGFYFLLVVFDWWLKFKSGGREQDGLTSILTSSIAKAKKREQLRDELQRPEEACDDSDANTEK